ncbi:MAG: phospholipase [Betaproteobacteria bacterium]
MRALNIYAGPRARAHVQAHGLQPAHVGVIPAAAGGPKGLILGPLDRFIFGQWLPQSSQSVALVGASIGAWRMATACLNQPVAAFERLEHDYIHQHYELPEGQKRVSAQQVSDEFGHNLRAFYGGRIAEVLSHPRYQLHIMTSHGQRLLGREHPWWTPVGYAAAFLSNAVQRRALGGWLERVVFSAQGAPLPFDAGDYQTLQCALLEGNFMDALQASCSIPFVLKAVHDIAGAPPGAYWDGGITDYHLHLRYAGLPAAADSAHAAAGIVLYPHFQKAVVPGWLDKGLKSRHQATPALDSMVLLAPNPAWLQTLPNGKLPDRTDFARYGNDLASRVKAWTGAASAAQQMADEFAAWLERPDMGQVLPI